MTCVRESYSRCLHSTSSGPSPTAPENSSASRVWGQPEAQEHRPRPPAISAPPVIVSDAPCQAVLMTTHSALSPRRQEMGSRPQTPFRCLICGTGSTTRNLKCLTHSMSTTCSDASLCGQLGTDWGFPGQAFRRWGQTLYWPRLGRYACSELRALLAAPPTPARSFRLTAITMGASRLLQWLPQMPAGAAGRRLENRRASKGKAEPCPSSLWAPRLLCPSRLPGLASSTHFATAPKPLPESSLSLLGSTPSRPAAETAIANSTLCFYILLTTCTDTCFIIFVLLWGN